MLVAKSSAFDTSQFKKTQYSTNKLDLEKINDAYTSGLIKKMIIM